MDFRPKNKYLLVELAEEKKPEGQTSGFILPGDLKVKLEPFKAVKLLRASPESSFADSVGHYLLVPTNSIEEVKVFNTVLRIVSETVVYGEFHNGDENYSRWVEGV